MLPRTQQDRAQYRRGNIAHIEALLRRRDERIYLTEALRQNPQQDIFEDCSLEIINYLPIRVDMLVAELNQPIESAN